MHRDLSAFLEDLDRARELVRVEDFVNPELEMAEVIDRLSKSPEGGKAILFEQTGTEFPVLANMMGSTQRMCMVLHVKSLEDIPQRLDKMFKQAMSPKLGLWDKLQLLPLMAEAARWFPKKLQRKGVCQSVTMQTPDLSKLPIIKSWPYDGGRFVTLPMVHTIDPKTKIPNVGMYRMHVFSDSTTGMHWHRHKTGARHYQAWKEAYEKGEGPDKMPVTVTLGGDPIYTYAATAPLPDGVDEYLLAGFLRNKPVNLVPCQTNELFVPEDVDFVLEGYIDLKEAKCIEGPFGDHTGFYSLPDLYPIFHLTAISHKPKPIYPATLVGIPPQEDAYIAHATEQLFMEPIKWLFLPEMKDLYMPDPGVAHNLVFVSIKKNHPGQAFKSANALWGAGQMSFNKVLLVFDDEVNIRSAEAVEQALRANYRPEQDTYFGKGTLDVLDHAAVKCGFGGKLCIDATRKLPEEQKNELDGHSNEILTSDTIEQQIGWKFIHVADAGKSGAKLEIILDEEVDLSDGYVALWIAANNIDPARDCTLQNGILRCDARAKRRGERVRDWPNVVTSLPQTIKTIDVRWKSLKLGAFIASPSAKYLRLHQAPSAYRFGDPQDFTKTDLT
jgi:4-hydroxy-3-polyprenylbenzoate decarboxylase